MAFTDLIYGETSLAHVMRRQNERVEKSPLTLLQRLANGVCELMRFRTGHTQLLWFHISSLMAD